MACYSPLTAFQLEGGEIVFCERGSVRRELTLPCGQCVGCRLERSRQWAVRCVHEAQMHEFSSFVTLTYDDEHCPVDLSLNYRDFQLFMKRVRKCFVNDRVRFYMCGEYGENFGRPHFHACLFGVFFRDRVPLSGGRSPLFRSPTLEKLWPFGYSSIGDVTFESAAYVARYVMKKVTGNAADEHYKRVSEDGEVFWLTPEFTRMSLRPGIGASWFEKFKSEVYPRDEVVVRGKVMKPPKYYDQLLRLDASFVGDEVEYERYKRAMKSSGENTAARLAVRAEVTRARLRFHQRSLK